MTFFADEVITIADGETKTLTRSTVDNDPGAARAFRATLTAYSAPVAYRYDAAPDTATKAHHLLAANESVVIEGYSNLINLQFKIASGTTTAQLFVSYAN